MSIFASLCSCLPIDTGTELIRNSYNKVMSYLTNNNQGQTLQEEQRFNDQQDQQCGISVYEITKHNAVIIKQPEEKAQHTIIDEPEGFVYDSNWNNHQILQAKGQYDMRCIKSILDMEPNNDGFQKILEQECNSIKIFHKLVLIQESKRINVYRYTFTIDIAIKQYMNIFTTQQLNKLDNSLDNWEIIQQVSNDLIVCHAEYKKILIIPPKDFIFLYYHHFDQQLLTYYSVGSSVQSSLAIKSGCTRGIVNLCGYSAKQIQQNKTTIQAYVNIDLDLKINPSMVKQPLKNQIRKYISKLITRSQQKQIKQNKVENQQLIS